MAWVVVRGSACAEFVLLAPLILWSAGCAKDEGPIKTQSTGGGANGGVSSGASAGTSTGPVLNLGGTTSSSHRLVVTAETTMRTVIIGQTPEQIQLKATEDGAPADAIWSVDRGDIGSISPVRGSSVAFTPTGKTGGSVRVSASTATGAGDVTLLVQLTGVQNGARTDVPAESAQVASSVADLIRGGGIAGVGGEGLGPAITDATVLAALAAPKSNGAAEKLALLYPYDGTVWPRGILAPLLMWDSSLGDADGIRIALSTPSGTFSWTGSFGRPQILEPLRAAQKTDAARAKLGRFVRHPIPQDVWEMATNTATARDPLDVELTVAKDGIAYGPTSQRWIVAEGRLTGTLYYNSYGTGLVANSGDQMKKGGGEFGAGVLAIRSGETGPRLVAGQPSTSAVGCRGCHLVSANGGRLIAQTGAYAPTVTYDLAAGSGEAALGSRWDSTFAWAALFPDGSLAFTSALRFAVPTADAAPFSQLYEFPPTATSTPITSSGVPSGVAAGTPAFSPDGKHLAFDFIKGTIGSLTGTGHELVVMDFDRSSMTFSNARLLARTSDPEYVGLPSFLPSGDAVIFHHHLSPSTSTPFLSPYGVHQQARLDWADLATGTPEPLFALNGARPDGQGAYLPANDLHPDDTILNYEPNVNPVATGGYFWVVFTSRRRYGNLADGDPWQSSPELYDYSDYSQVTSKKIWVSAIDINRFTDQRVGAGSEKRGDPSHPAFYLPAQELVAGNSRGFWVLDSCRSNGQECVSGDQCCEGFCRPNGSDGRLACSSPPSSRCAQTQERCRADADCCDPASFCINGFCAIVAPQVPR